jgi:hypothetical protein
LFHLATLDLRFVNFLPLPYEISKHTHLIVVVLVEIETIAMPETDLEEIVVKALFGDLDLSGSIFKGILNLLVAVVDDP